MYQHPQHRFNIYNYDINDSKNECNGIGGIILPRKKREEDMVMIPIRIHIIYKNWYAIIILLHPRLPLHRIIMIVRPHVHSPPLRYVVFYIPCRRRPRHGVTQQCHQRIGAVTIIITIIIIIPTIHHHNPHSIIIKTTTTMYPTTLLHFPSFPTR